MIARDLGPAGAGTRGPVAPDGSPVEVYLALPRPPEVDAIHHVLPPGGSVLDLGCGTGRFARALAALGHPVTAVDHAPAMVAAVQGVAGVTPIEHDLTTLRLGRSFDAVLLASHLVNDDDLGPQALATARAHLGDDGMVIGEVYPPGMDWVAAVGRRSVAGPVGITVTRARVAGDELDACVRYDLGERAWEQPFRARLLDETALDARLGAAGFGRDGWLDERGGWFLARPIATG